MSNREGFILANIKEIARAAGVSVSTVSRVLNHHPYVREDKRKAVLDAIQRLNYSPNMNAVHLSRGKTGAIGVILPQINLTYFSRMVEGMSDEALKSGIRLMMCQTGYQPEEEQSALEMLRHKQVDGILICSHSLSPSIIASYSEFGPIALCEDTQDLPLSSVYLDHYDCFCRAIRYLWSKGHRRIGYTIGRSNGLSSSQRFAAYSDTLKSLQGECRSEWILGQCLSIEDGVDALRRILNMKERPTALLVTGDQIAAGILIEAQRQGLQVPDDLAIIGFDNQPISKVLGITTIDNGLYEMGSTAFRIVQEQIDSGKTAPVKKQIEFRLIERATV